MDHDPRKILHQIRNALTPIQTLIQVVEIDDNDSKLRTLHSLCEKNLKLIRELLQKLEPSPED